MEREDLPLLKPSWTDEVSELLAGNRSIEASKLGLSFEIRFHQSEACVSVSTNSTIIQMALTMPIKLTLWPFNVSKGLIHFVNLDGSQRKLLLTNVISTDTKNLLFEMLACALSSSRYWEHSG